MIFSAKPRPRVAGELRVGYMHTFCSTDASLYQVMPHAVLIPRHTDDMRAAIELAAKYSVPLLPRWQQCAAQRGSNAKVSPIADECAQADYRITAGR